MPCEQSLCVAPVSHVLLVLTSQCWDARLCDAVRDKLESIDWKTLPIDDAGGYEAVLGGVDNITIAEPEPDLDLDGEESDTDSEATVV